MTYMAKKPHQNTALAKFLDRRVLQLKPVKSQAEIAEEAGFVSPNMMSMLRSGASKLPIDRVPALAKALDCDPAYLLQMALEQVAGDTVARAMIEIMGTPVTKNEEQWLEEIRSASGNTDPRLTSRTKAALRAIFA